LRLAASIITGVGFIGAGLIMFKKDKVTGITTAAGLWVSAAIGLAVGFQLFALAIIATIMTIIVSRANIATGCFGPIEALLNTLITVIRRH